MGARMYHVVIDGSEPVNVRAATPSSALTKALEGSKHLKSVFMGGVHQARESVELEDGRTYSVCVKSYALGNCSKCNRTFEPNADIWFIGKKAYCKGCGKRESGL